MPCSSSVNLHFDRETSIVISKDLKDQTFIAVRSSVTIPDSQSLNANRNEAPYRPGASPYRSFTTNTNCCVHAHRPNAAQIQGAARKTLLVFIPLIVLLWRVR
ncbi:MAG: hypothetical protein ACLPWF_23460 [Bryobacteraceae bacterium]